MNGCKAARFWRRGEGDEPVMTFVRLGSGGEMFIFMGVVKKKDILSYLISALYKLHLP